MPSSREAPVVLEHGQEPARLHLAGVLLTVLKAPSCLQSCSLADAAPFETIDAGSRDAALHSAQESTISPGTRASRFACSKTRIWLSNGALAEVTLGSSRCARNRQWLQ